MKEALRNVEDELRYFRLELRDIKVTKAKPLVRPLFCNFKVEGFPLIKVLNSNHPAPLTGEIGALESTFWLRRAAVLPEVLEWRHS